MASAKHGPLFTEADVRRFADDVGVPQDLVGSALAGLRLTFPADEPLFLIRGQDRTAPDAIREYAKHARRQGAPAELVADALAAADEFERYQFERGARRPD